MQTNQKPWETLAAGQTWRGWWETGHEGLPDVPVLAARGVQSGPTLLITAGVHGDEYEGPAAIQALFDRVEPNQLHGTLLGLPVVNLAAWQAHNRVAPGDGLDLNRVFPGATGEAAHPTQILAHKIFETFVRACDALVDLHSGGVRLAHLPMVGWYPGNGEAERLARGFGPPFHPWVMPKVAGVLSYEAQRVGKVAIGAEWGGGASLDQAGASAYTAGLRWVLAALEMLPAPEEALLDARQPITGQYQTTESGGLFVPTVRLGDWVASGDSIGALRDPLGQVVIEIKAQHTGIVAALPHLPLLQPGDRIAYIG